MDQRRGERRPGDIALHDHQSGRQQHVCVYGRATRAAGFQQIAIPVRTINEITMSAGGDLPDIVKIDAEGLDLECLPALPTYSADGHLPRGGRFAAAIKFREEVIEFMANAGYRLMDITELNRSPKHGVLWLCELAFLRNGSTLLEAASSYE